MDSSADRLKKIRVERGYKTASAAAKRFGWTTSTYTSHENGTRPLTRAFKTYAKAFRISEAWLRCLSEDRNSGVRGAVVMGEAAAGVWREATVDMMPHELEKIIDVPAKADEDLDDVRFSVRVADDSVNRALPQEWYAICAPMAEGLHSPDEFTVGEMLYIERSRKGLKELSLRRVSGVNADRIKLSTYSTVPRWVKQPDVTYPGANAGEKVRIVGRVVGKYADYLPD